MIRGASLDPINKISPDESGLEENQACRQVGLRWRVSHRLRAFMVGWIIRNLKGCASDSVFLAELATTKKRNEQRLPRVL
jgi:hypothetical protein